MPELDDPARFPFFPFFVDDWIASSTVGSMTLEQQGVYLLLLARQWKARDGLLPKDQALLAKWTGLGGRWPKVGRPVLERCFAEREKGYCNLKLHRLWARAKSKSAKARASAELRWERAQTVDEV